MWSYIKNNKRKQAHRLHITYTTIFWQHRKSIELQHLLKNEQYVLKLCCRILGHGFDVFLSFSLYLFDECACACCFRYVLSFYCYYHYYYCCYFEAKTSKLWCIFYFINVLLLLCLRTLTTDSHKHPLTHSFILNNLVDSWMNALSVFCFGCIYWMINIWICSWNEWFDFDLYWRHGMPYSSWSHWVNFMSGSLNWNL